ncbi:protein of unknown function [Taphrina deformans PYCC 5710]|uniref:Uncharacterized protein n=1 Tax=Taphrina deformans (strain PYCC 5710 / ATCC 11124 / CBS 356.35 / IMI 108563 / JCM 9778 / NBRC 8474) TaxID=1097556 RepID=R4X9D0_TAPDE|nr:protein of unknown function [Taphrina deformans PYCC 5710]|eukprot:CCG82341.1 protein of unknown function [Taphrina deformans PYCC 5710]
MLFRCAALFGLALAIPVEKRAIPDYYSQADGQIIKNPTSTTGLTPLTLTLTSAGGLIDQANRICYTVVATGQLQCSTPVITQPVTQTGFSNINGNLAQNGNTVFYQCETVGGQANNFHIYNHNDGEICFQTTIPLGSPIAAATTAATKAASTVVVVTAVRTSTVTTSGRTSTVVLTSTFTTTRAVTVVVTRTSTTLRPATTTAKAGAAAPTVVAASTAAPTSPNLYPRLIVPVVTGQGAQGTKFFVTVNSNTKSDLLFDVAANSGYKTCTLVGRFPVGGSPTSSGAYGSAQIQASLLTTNINTSTSAASQPAVKTDLGTRAAGTATNGANAVYASFAVTAGQSYSIALTAVSGSINLFEDYNAPVVGYTLNCV